MANNPFLCLVWALSDPPPGIPGLGPVDPGYGQGHPGLHPGNRPPGSWGGEHPGNRPPGSWGYLCNGRRWPPGPPRPAP